jgi:hypothetical protein
VHEPEQQSALVVQVPPLRTHGTSHEPARQKPVQQSALVRHAPATGRQSGGGGWHLAWLQPKLQHSALCVQSEPFGEHGDWHTRRPSTRLHAPRQQSASVVQATPCGRHVWGPKSQRSVVSLQTSQQPRPVPLVQSSPVGRQSRFGSSIAHSPRAPSQMFEQHSAFSLHGSPSTTHRPPPQLPFLHPSEQQSVAFSQLAPSRRQKSVQRRSGWPVTGSQRPLQHSAAALQIVSAPAQAPNSMQDPSTQACEQHASGWLQVFPAGKQAVPPAVPPAADPPEPVPAAAPLPVLPAMPSGNPPSTAPEAPLPGVPRSAPESEPQLAGSSANPSAAQSPKPHADLPEELRRII